MTQQKKRLSEDEERSAGKKPVYAGTYEKDLERSAEKLSSRPDFQYDMGEDGLYKQYKDQYTAEGRRAMRDSMGQAAALTGGYASSYAQRVGQQSYDEHLGRLNEIVPELYSLAWQRYLNEGDELEKEHERLQQLRADEYRSYTDALSRYERQEQQDYERERDLLDDEREREQQEYKRALEQAENLAKYGNFDGYARLYGNAVAGQMKNYWISSNPEAALQQGLISLEHYYALTGSAPAASGTSGSKKTYPGTAPDGRDARTVQQELRNMGYNIAVDGAWGPKSQAAWDKAYGKGAIAVPETDYLMRL